MMQEEKHQAESTEDEYYETQDIIVDPKQTSIRIDKFLIDRVQRSRNQIQLAIKAGAVTVNDKLVKSNYKVRPNDKIRLVIPRYHPSEQGVKPQEMPLDIRYEDDDLLILHKPPGLVVHPGVGNWDNTLVNGLSHYFGEDLDMESGNPYQQIGLVHRIDKHTSGLLVIAKNEQTLTNLAKQFFDHTIERTYYALVWGDVENDKGTIDEFIGRDTRDRKKFRVYKDRDIGKHAITHYEVVERLYYVTLIKCRLETGRTHQIRVHMKYAGHTLFNDHTYGGDRILKGTVYTRYKAYVQKIFGIMPRQALHAKSLGFTHPGTGERVFFESDVPEDFQQCLEKWRSYVSQRMKNKEING